MLSAETESAIRRLVRVRIKQKIDTLSLNPNSASNAWMNYSGESNPNAENTKPASWWPFTSQQARHYLQSSMYCTAEEDTSNGPLRITMYLRYDVKRTNIRYDADGSGSIDGTESSNSEGPPSTTKNYEAFNAYIAGLDDGDVKPGGPYGDADANMNPPFIGAAGMTATNDTLPGCIKLLRNGTQINPST